MEKEQLTESSQLNHSLFKETIPVKKYILNVGLFNHEDGVLDKIYAELESATTNDIIEINISSDGGLLSELNRLTNIINDKFYKRVTTKLNPYGYSAGAMLFLIGDTRVVYPNSKAMFHEASFGLSGKHSDLKSQTKFSEKYLNSFIIDNLEAFFTNKELDELLSGKEMWLDSLDMCKRNIATHISIYDKLIPSEEYVSNMKDNKSRKKFYDDILKDGELSSIDELKVKCILKKLKNK